MKWFYEEPKHTILWNNTIHFIFNYLFIYHLPLLVPACCTFHFCFCKGCLHNYSCQSEKPISSFLTGYGGRYKIYGSVQLSSVVHGHHVYKTVWTPLALAFVAFPLSCGSLSIVNVVCSAVVSCTSRLRAAYLSHAPNKGCDGRLKTMRLTVLNNEVRLTTEY